MKTEFITPEIFVEINDNDGTPIIIEVCGAFINVTIDELEKIYYYCKNQMENKTKIESPSIKDVLEDAHGMTHDISYNIGQGNIDEAKRLLKEQDVLLHDAIHQQGLSQRPSNLHPVFESIADAIRPR